MQETKFDPWSWKIPYAEEQRSLCACTTATEARVLEPISATTEATAMKSLLTETDQPPLTATRKSPCAVTKVQQSQYISEIKINIQV